MSKFKEKRTKQLFLTLFGLFFATFLVFTLPLNNPAHADVLDNLENVITPEENKNSTDTKEETDEEQKEGLLDIIDDGLTETFTTEKNKEKEAESSVCKDQSDAIGWLICPTTGVIAKASDAIYSIIEDILIINPTTVTNESTIHVVWQYMRDITNIVFILFLFVVVISHLTDFGISNYNLKRILPRLIIVAILVNVSFIICQLAIDISNILGASIRGTFTSIEEQAIANGATSAIDISWTDIINAVTTTGVIAGAGVTFTGSLVPLFWTLAPILLGALVSVIIGLITIALRQGLVMVLAMIAPLAFVCFLLPNTEGWFKKWKSLFMKMLTFYPMFSLLFGASHIAGWAIITSSVNAEGETSGFGVIIGLAVQIFPLFGSWSLMKMSGTILGNINQKLNGIAAKPLARFGRLAEERKLEARQNYLNNSNSIGATMRRYSDYKAGLRHINYANLKSKYDNDIQKRVNKRLVSGYNPVNSERNDLQANKYLRNAKQARIAEMENSTSMKDVAHVLDKYGEYYGKASAIDSGLGARSASAWLDFNRANFTQVADEEADFDYLVDQYISFNKLGKNRNNPYYQYYIHSVSPDGKFSVMGQLINKASAVEMRRRRDYNTMISKWNFDKRNFRNMAIGYYCDDDGFATDANGNKLGEEQPGQFLETNPDRLALYDKYDGDRAYFDWYDQGEFVMRVYRDDSAFMKEAFSNFDTVINDPENALYGILAGVDSGTYMPTRGANETDEDYQDRIKKFKNIGLSKYATTLGRAILASGYKEKNAAYSPYMAEMIKNRRIKTTGQNNIAQLDSLLKGAKAGVFLTNDQASLRQYAWMLDPTNFEAAFPDADIETYCDVNGKTLKGLRKEVDPDGTVRFETVPRETATLEEKKQYLLNDYVMKAMNMMLQMMTKNTPNISENQKTSTKDALAMLKSSIDKWSDLDLTRDLIENIKNKSPYLVKNPSLDSARDEIKNIFKQNSAIYDMLTEIESFRHSETDTDIFKNEMVRILSGVPSLDAVYHDFIDYTIDNNAASIDQMYETIIYLLSTYHSEIED